MTKPNTSRTIKKPASLRSDGVRDYPGMPFGFPSELAFSFAGIPTLLVGQSDDSDVDAVVSLNYAPVIHNRKVLQAKMRAVASFGDDPTKIEILLPPGDPQVMLADVATKPDFQLFGTAFRIRIPRKSWRNGLLSLRTP